MTPAEADLKPWQRACKVPETLRAKEADLYRRLRTHHCGSGHASGDCHGRLTIDRNGITLACHVCGDARMRYPKEPEA